MKDLIHFYPRIHEKDIGKAISNVYLHGMLEEKFNFDCVTTKDEFNLADGIYKCTVEGFDGPCYLFVWVDKMVPMMRLDDIICGYKGLIVAQKDTKENFQYALDTFIEKPIII